MNQCILLRWRAFPIDLGSLNRPWTSASVSFCCERRASPDSLVPPRVVERCGCWPFAFRLDADAKLWRFATPTGCNLPSLSRNLPQRAALAASRGSGVSILELVACISEEKKEEEKRCRKEENSGTRNAVPVSSGTKRWPHLDWFKASHAAYRRRPKLEGFSVPPPRRRVEAGGQGPGRTGGIVGRNVGNALIAFSVLSFTRLVVFTQMDMFYCSLVSVITLPVTADSRGSFGVDRRLAVIIAKAGGPATV